MTATVEPVRAAPADARVVILAETPNAGRFHHRFLASPGCWFDAAAAAELFARYRSSADGLGIDFLGVDREVVQRETDRPAREILLVAGLDTGRLAPAERDAIQYRLRERIPRLAELSEMIDWESDVALVCERPELAGWIDPTWPVAARRPPRDTPGDSKRRWPLWIFIGIALLALVALVTPFFPWMGLFVANAANGLREPKGATDPATKPEPAKPKSRTLADLIGQWHDETTESEKDLKADLAAIVGWTKTASNGTLENAPAIRPLLAATDMAPISPDLLLKPESRIRLVPLLPGGAFNPESFVRYRRDLRATAAAFEELQKAAKSIPGIPFEESQSRSWYDWIAELNIGRFEVRPAKVHPAVPLYAPDDLAILERLEDYLGGRYAEAALAAGEFERNPAGKENGESRLRRFAERMGPRIEILNGSIDSEFTTLAKGLSERDRESLNATKEHMKIWLESVSKLHRKR